MIHMAREIRRSGDEGKKTGEISTEAHESKCEGTRVGSNEQSGARHVPSHFPAVKGGEKCWGKEQTLKSHPEARARGNLITSLKSRQSSSLKQRSEACLAGSGVMRTMSNIVHSVPETLLSSCVSVPGTAAAKMNLENTR